PGDPGRGLQAERRVVPARVLRGVGRADRAGSGPNRPVSRGPRGRERIVSAEPCLMCARVAEEGELFVAELPTSRVYLNEDQFFPGWVYVVFRRHATELYELTPEERAALIED